MRLETDIVVVGAGSAGAVVAARLAGRGRQVTLLEAGPDWRSADCLPELRHPSPEIFAWKVEGRTPDGYFWPGLSATRRPGGEPAAYLRGMGVGGTSTINGLVVIRPPLEEFDDWVARWGCTGWGAADVLPYFVRLEDDLDFGDEPYHGHGGPLPVARRPESEWGLMDEVLAGTALAAGHPSTPDYNAPRAMGVSPTAMNIRAGMRVTTNDAYLEPARHLAQLTVRGGTTVDRVLVEREQAVGVRALGPDGPTEVRAAEVVLCAGAQGSPAILQRSGIGPAALLRSLGVTVVADLPVGVGIQDHVGFWLSVELARGRAAETGARGNCTLRYSSGLRGRGGGDVLMVSANPLTKAPEEGALGVKLAECFSRGSLRITSRDPLVPPAIELGLLVDERDLLLARRALRDALELLASRACEADVVAVRDRHGGDVRRGMSDAEVDAWLGRNAYDTAHLSGGARMGAERTSVVDTDCGVHGIGGLSVADMSVVPTVPRANTLLTAVMIGERLADILAHERAPKNVDDLVDEVVDTL